MTLNKYWNLINLSEKDSVKYLHNYKPVIAYKRPKKIQDSLTPVMLFIKLLVKQWKIQYVGQTGQLLSKRLNSYRFDLKVLMSALYVLHCYNVFIIFLTDTLGTVKYRCIK